MDMLLPYGQAIIAALNPQPPDQILDIASGTGEPALTLASMVPEGHVQLTDLSSGMLSVAREKALERGVHNVSIDTADVSSLPFEAQSFDKVSCRMGFMFFPSMELAAQEIFRVLKNGGTFATCVWTKPERNFWVTAIMDIIKQKLSVPTPPPGSPGMFRCAQEETMVTILSQAGFSAISTKEVFGTATFETAEMYWTMFNEVGAPIVAALSNATDVQVDEIKQEVISEVQRRLPSQPHIFETCGYVIRAEKI